MENGKKIYKMLTLKHAIFLHTFHFLFTCFNNIENIMVNLNNVHTIYI